MTHVRAAAALVWSAAGRWLVVRVVLTAAVAAIPVVLAWLTKVILDRLAAQSGAVLVPALLFAGTGVGAVVLPQAVRYADGELRRRVGLVAREQLYRSVSAQAGLGRLESPQFHDRLTLATGPGITAAPELVTSTLGAVQGLLTFAGFLGTLAVLNPWMLLLAGLAAVPTLAAEVRMARYRVRVQSDLGHAWRREYFYANLLTSMSAAKEIRLYGLDRMFCARMLAELVAINAGHRRIDRREFFVQGLQGVLSAVVAGLGLVWAANAALAGQLSVGDVSVFIAALAGVQIGLSIVVSSLGEAHEAIQLVGHHRHIVEAGPDLPAPVGTRRRTVPRLRRGIELCDVWFRYGDGLPWIVRGVDLSIPAGGATALVGHNGAGKSTLVKLLCRFYDPCRGVIRWDGIDIRDLPVGELRRRIGAVFQDYMAYELSAAENIGVGDPTALTDRERIVRAARKAGSDATISGLPAGYDTLLTRIFVDGADRDDPGTGVVLSGGQWQRVALARALVREDCDLLILDEPSSGLDAEAEHEIHARLAELRRGRASLLVSHRLNAVRDADSIVVLTGGTVTERGTHADLMLAGGTYARLFRLQAAGFEASAETRAD
jgi:ATP-binding cassette subfamily B protein